MEFEDFTWNFMGIMQTKIAMPTKRGGQDPSKRSRDRRMVRWCLACPTIHEYRRLPFFAPLAQTFFFGAKHLSPAFSMLLAHMQSLRCTKLTSAVFHPSYPLSHTHTTASCRYLFLDGWNVICMRMLVVWNMTFIFSIYIYIYIYIGNFLIPTDFHIFQRGGSNQLHSAHFQDELVEVDGE